MFKSLLIASLTVVMMAGCASKKKAEDSAAPVGTEGTKVEDTAISNAPMSFDVQGSDSGKIAGLTTVHFEYDKYSLTEEARSTLAKNSDWMKSHPNVNIQIEGHCDSRGSIEYNLALGEKRAKVTKDYLVKMGIPAAKLSLISYGKEKPLDKGENEEAWSKNRRANFVPLSN